MPRLSYRRVGGLRFIRIGFLVFSFCVSRRPTAIDLDAVEAEIAKRDAVPAPMPPAF